MSNFQTNEYDWKTDDDVIDTHTHNGVNNKYISRWKFLLISTEMKTQ